MHTFVQDGDDADVWIAQYLAVDKMLPVTQDMAIHTELGGDRT